MPVQSVENAKLNVNFKSGINIERASTFVNMDDSQLKYLSYVNSFDAKAEKKRNKSFSKWFFAIPIVDSIAMGLLVNRGKRSSLGQKAIAELRNASLSTRFKAAGKTAMTWGLVLSLVSLYNIAKNAVASKSEKVRNFDKNNPLTSFAVDVGLIFGGLTFAERKFAKLSPKTYLKHPKPFVKLNDFIEKTKTFLNESAVNTKFVPKASKFVSEIDKTAPSVNRFGRFALRNSMWILLGAGILKMASNAGHERRKVEKNYHELKAAQFEVAKHLVNALGVERDVLAQDKRKLAADLRHEMNKAQPPEEVETQEVED
ncbi:MAG: hypothetical protein WCY19_02195 [Candidatus Gastranaerophilaceae bacterium]